MRNLIRQAINDSSASYRTRSRIEEGRRTGEQKSVLTALFDPLAPMRWLDVKPSLRRGISPPGSCATARKNKSVNAPLIEHRNLQIFVEWRDRKPGAMSGRHCCSSIDGMISDKAVSHLDLNQRPIAALYRRLMYVRFSPGSCRSRVVTAPQSSHRQKSTKPVSRSSVILPGNQRLSTATSGARWQCWFTSRFVGQHAPSRSGSRRERKASLSRRGHNLPTSGITRRQTKCFSMPI